MKVYGRSAVSEFLGDSIVYRNLVPMDGRLPRLEAVRAEIGLPVGIPRKNDPDYARFIVHLLRAARSLEAPGVEIRRLVYLGDTQLSDGTAFVNLCSAGGWAGAAFIGAENAYPPEAKTTALAAGQFLFRANRWTMLAEDGELGFPRFCAERGLGVDETTALVIDLDKTAIGARGRNAACIDAARVQAVRATVAGLLGADFDPVGFETVYYRLNHPEFHPFTADNQDYLAYICLILGAGLHELEAIMAAVHSGQLSDFEAFIRAVDVRADELPPGLRAIHAEIYANVRAGDPTPFKPFRRSEYRFTVGKMGKLAEGVPVERLLAEEIVITGEVRQLALDWKRRGALLFGLSDKPDEASIPTPELAAQGFRPIHQTETQVVGE